MFYPTDYLRRISTTILAPTPLVAANFVILGRLIGRLGQQYSRLDRHWCKPCFPYETMLNTDSYQDLIIFSSAVNPNPRFMCQNKL